MGAGIAQVAATHGHKVALVDADPNAITRATGAIMKNLDRLVEKGKLTNEDATAIRDRINLSVADAAESSSLDDFHDCALIIEAVVEKLDVKRSLFARLESVVADDAVLATNTSSLSITAIASGCKHPERIVGIHFFNPPTVLPLVEIVPGLATSPSVTASARALVDSWADRTRGRDPERRTYLFVQMVQPYPEEPTEPTDPTEPTEPTG